MNTAPRTIEWVGEMDGLVRLIDQTLLPTEFRTVECRDAESMWDTIRSLRVRGAPAIGVAGAMGVVLGVRKSRAKTIDEFRADVGRVADYLRSSRPTAVNLFWAIDRMQRAVESHRQLAPRDIVQRLLV